MYQDALRDCISFSFTWFDKFANLLLKISVLQNVLKKQAADRILGQSRAKEVMKGWIIKVKLLPCNCFKLT